MQKIKIGHRAKFRDRDNFSAGFISVSRDFTPYFHFRCVARANFDRNLIHSADACFLVMASVGYSRVQLKTLSSLELLKAFLQVPLHLIVTFSLQFLISSCLLNTWTVLISHSE